jgi:hypothetical protein
LAPLHPGDPGQQSRLRSTGVIEVDQHIDQGHQTPTFGENWRPIAECAPDGCLQSDVRYLGARVRRNRLVREQ